MNYVKFTFLPSPSACGPKVMFKLLNKIKWLWHRYPAFIPLQYQWYCFLEVYVQGSERIYSRMHLLMSF